VRRCVRTALLLGSIAPSLLLAGAGAAEATQLTTTTGALSCQVVPLKHHIELELCVAVDQDPDNGLYATSDITAYRVKHGTRVVDPSVQVSTEGTSCAITAGTAHDTCGAPGYPQGPSGGYQRGASRGFFGTTSGTTFQLSASATFALWEHGSQVSTWTFASPPVSYTAP
jgi:hypothetical protein